MDGTENDVTISDIHSLFWRATPSVEKGNKGDPSVAFVANQDKDRPFD
jgi:hypothetical protein